MRDDDIPFGYGSDRQSDNEWFSENPSRFRILSTTLGDDTRAGLEPLPIGLRSIRLSRFPGARVSGRWDTHVAAAMVFAVAPEQSERINSYSDPELEQLWVDLLSKGTEIEVGTEPIYQRPCLRTPRRAGNSNGEVRPS